MKMESGIYETYWGSQVIYNEGQSFGIDLSEDKVVMLSGIDFTKKISNLEKKEK